MLFAALLAPLLAVGVAADKRDLNPGEIAGLIENFKSESLHPPLFWRMCTQHPNNASTRQLPI